MLVQLVFTCFALSLSSPARATDLADPRLRPAKVVSRPSLVAGQVTGAALGASLGYGAGFLARLGATGCESEHCEPYPEVIEGALIWGPVGAIAGGVGGVFTVRSAQRGHDLAVLGGALGATAVGGGLLYASAASEEGGLPALSLLGAATALVGAPLVAHGIAAATERPVRVMPVGPRATPGVTLGMDW